MRTISYILLIIIGFSNLQAQSIMLIPLEQNMIFNDSESEMQKDNEMKISDIRFMFQNAINTNLNAQIIDEKKMQTRNLFLDSSKEVQRDLQLLYNSVSLGKADNPEFVQQQKKPFYVKIKEKVNRMKDDDEANTEEIGIVKDKPLEIFINANVRNKNTFTKLSQKYNTNYFVFVNQLELRTQYKSCLDRSVRLFERDYDLHYTVIDAEGNQVAGGVSTIHVNKNTNDVEEIVTKYFPKLVDKVKMGLNGAKPNSVQTSQKVLDIKLK